MNTLLHTLGLKVYISILGKVNAKAKPSLLGNAQQYKNSALIYYQQFNINIVVVNQSQSGLASLQ